VTIVLYGFKCPRCWRRWTATRLNDQCPFCAARNVRGYPTPDSYPLKDAA
jgi:hypothetical protein